MASCSSSTAAMAMAITIFLFLLSFVTPVFLAKPVHHAHHPRFASHNYRDALAKSIIYFEGQRSGKLPSSQRITWRKDSGLSDGKAMGVCFFFLSFWVFLILQNGCFVLF